MVAEHIKHWRIGEVDIVRIVEVNAHADDFAVLLKDGTPDLADRLPWMRPHFVDGDRKMLISFQCFALRTRGRNIMIDTCIGKDRQRPFDLFCNMPSPSSTISASPDFRRNRSTRCCVPICTSTMSAGTRCWSTANGSRPSHRRAICSASAEWDHWKHVPRGTDPHVLHLDDAVQPILDAGLAEFVASDYRLSDEVWLEPTPGHTPGHVSVHIQSAGQKAIITGDLVHHPVQFAEPEMHGNFDMDPALAGKSRRKFLETYEGRDTLIIGSHFCDPSCGWIERDERNWRLAVE